jgi:hypothetical protein
MAQHTWSVYVMTRFVIVATFMFVLPACGTIDPIPERTDVQEKCRVDGKWLTSSPFAPGNHAIVGEEAAVALLNAQQHHWVLQPATCALQEVKLSPATTSERVNVWLTSIGDVRFSVIGLGELPLRYGLLDVATGTASETTARQFDDGPPYHLRFSRDGRWAAWIAGEETDNPTVQGGPAERLEVAFEFEPAARFGPGSYAVVDVADDGNEILIGKDFGDSFLLVDRTGSLIWAFARDNAVFTTLDTVRLSRDGQAYLRWDAYRARGPYAVHWRIAGQLVRRELPEDSFIGSAAVSSDWKWIAASTNMNTRGGSGVEAITVWSADGRVRFHKRLKPATRTPVVFLPGNLLAYVEVDENWRGVTRVIALE